MVIYSGKQFNPSLTFESDEGDLPTELGKLAFLINIRLECENVK
jgi:hypothetical protein